MVGEKEQSVTASADTPMSSVRQIKEVTMLDMLPIDKLSGKEKKQNETSFEEEVAEIDRLLNEPSMEILARHEGSKMVISIEQKRLHDRQRDKGELILKRDTGKNTNQFTKDIMHKEEERQPTTGAGVNNNKNQKKWKRLAGINGSNDKVTSLKKSPKI